MTKLSQAIALATAMTAGLAITTTAQAEVEVAASAAVSNMYLWRGQDLGQDTNGTTGGVPAISGDLTVSASGAYAGVWTSSGDASNGQEYDLYVGYGMEAGEVALDISYWTYIYPGADNDDIADLHEIIASAAFKGASLGVYYNIDQDEDDQTDYFYTTLGYEYNQFSATYGIQTYSDTEDGDYSHINLSYAYNDNLSFTLSQIVSADLDEDENGLDRSPKVVVTYSLPIEL
ncbi:MAG: hypothetical protein JKY50_08315 [Oleispira sp.]|nr:hypothetical protein [Oleispira sp.]MBL4880980.1 hypothetical protein [Oleispira sp.]